MGQIPQEVEELIVEGSGKSNSICQGLEVLSVVNLQGRSLS